MKNQGRVFLKEQVTESIRNAGSICIRRLSLIGLMIILNSSTAFAFPYGTGYGQQINIETRDQENPEMIAQDKLPSSISDYIDGIITSQRREHKLSAVTVSVIQNDSLIFAKGYGLSDIESNRVVQADQTLFRIGSVSKTFTWTAVMMLVEQGLINLDADVNTYLRDVEVAEAFGEPVTMRHLMSHRAGFESSIVLFTVADDDPRTRSQLLSDHQPKRVYPPGLRTSYSNWGAALAAQVVEDVTGIPYKTYLQEEILNPLGMNHTVTDLPEEMAEDRRDDLATGYKTRQGALDLQGYMQLGEYWPAGGVASTATDMARWMQFHLNGGQLDSIQLMTPETHDQMWTRAYNDRPNGADVAHGFQDTQYLGLRLLGHGGGTAAFLTKMVMVPELNLGVFTSQNGAYGFSQIKQLTPYLIDALYDESFQPDLYENASTEQTDELAGTYLNNRRVFSTFAAVMALGSEATLSPVSDRAIVLSSGGESTYYQKVENLGDVFENADGERLSIIRDSKGGVAALADDSGIHTLERIGFMRKSGTMMGSFALVLVLTFTSLMSTWRRFGKGNYQGFLTRVAGAVRFVSALSVIMFTVAVLYMVMSASDIDTAEIAGNYPLLSMTLSHYAGWFVAIMSLITIAGLWPAWKGSGWKLLGRLHYSIYALSLLFFTILLWQWRVIGAAVV